MLNAETVRNWLIEKYAASVPTLNVKEIISAQMCAVSTAIEKTDQPAATRVDQDGITAIDLRDYLSGGFEGRSFASNIPLEGTAPDGLYVVKAWAKHM